MNALRMTAITVSLASLWAQVQAQALEAPGASLDGMQLAQAAGATPWKEGGTYTVGQLVSYNGRTYAALVGHTAWAGTGWNPEATPSLWRLVSGGSPPAPNPPAPNPPAPNPPAPNPPAPNPPAPNPPAPNPPAPNPPAPGPGDQLTLPEAVKATQNKRVYVGYYPSWSDAWFDSTGKSANEIFKASKFARIPGTYTHVMVAFGDPNFSWAGLSANSWSGTGINFTATPRDIKAAIDVLHQRNMKVLLAVGGATYHNWDALAADGQRGSGPVIDALARFMTEMGIDGLDVDYEVDANVPRYANAIKAMRKAVDKAGGGRILASATWSTGADCTAATSAHPDCSGKVSFWGGSAGRERQLMMQFPDAAKSLDMVNIMTYDARYENYDGVTAYNEYRKLWPSRTIVSIGFEPAPEGWAGGMLVVNNGDAQCEGSRNLKNSYGTAINQPYSVERYSGAVLASNPNRNPRDGAMLWSILKPANGSCGGAPLASPGSIGQKLQSLFGLSRDPALQSPEWR
ncbi:glycosyl hydrolase family 18 protein [Aquabacterium sp. A7-Y]|uniref:glycosyl hydrolase family 18 protein n=1 Tax=Aquabacterium sp. A7-Y TaxID=1349605 RepID=UPI00223E28A6|nr:glycosyl hydrolase family 18 protein [Aquabacterium sp. A7-Y]MCW7540600.1 glycosyl hydrolase family 18 protein [Aquabacterium sp. A7-Y]